MKIISAQIFVNCYYLAVSLVVGIIHILKPTVLRKVNQLLVGEIHFKPFMEKLFPLK
jgi:hypothetical protein